MGIKNFAKGWIGKLMIWFSGLVGFTASSIGIVEFAVPKEGVFLAIVNNTEVEPPVTRNILIYMDKDSVDVGPLRLMPQFSNPTKYPVEDLLLTYNIDCQNANVTCTDYYSLYRAAGGEEVRNMDKTLYPRTEQPDAFMAFVLRNNGNARVKIRATYKGVDNPFEYEVRFLAKRVWDSDSARRARAVIDDAYQHVSASLFDSVDIYVLDNERVLSYTGVTANGLRSAYNKAHAPVQSTTTTTHPNDANRYTPADKTKTADNEETATVTANDEPSQPVVKTVPQIAKEAKESVQAAKDNEGTPWYMYVINVLLFLTFFIGSIVSFACFMDMYEEKSKKKLLWFIFCYVMTYAAAYLWCVLSMDYAELHFFGGFLAFTIVLFSLFIGIPTIDTCLEKWKINETLSEFISFFAIGLLIALSFGLACVIYPLIPF